MQHLVVNAIVSTMIGYVYFQIYKNIDDGRKYSGKSSPIILKNYREKKPKHVIVYAGESYEIFKFVDFMYLLFNCKKEIQEKLRPILGMV